MNKNSVFCAVLALVFLVLCGQSSCPAPEEAMVVEACNGMLPAADENGVRTAWRGSYERVQVGCFEIHRAPSAEPFVLDLSVAGDLDLYELYSMQVILNATVVDKDGGRSPVTVTKEVEPASQIMVVLPEDFQNATVIRLDLQTKTGFPEYIEEGSLKVGFVMPDGDVRPNDEIQFRTAFLEIFPVYAIGETQIDAGDEFLATVVRISTNLPNFNWAGVDIYAYPVGDSNLSAMIQDGSWNLYAQDFGEDGEIYPWENEDSRLTISAWTYQETAFEPIPYEDKRAGFIDISIWIETAAAQNGQFYMYLEWANAGAAEFDAPTLNCCFYPFLVGDVTVR